MFASSTLRRAQALPVTSLASRAFSTTSRASLARMQVIGRLAAEPELQSSSTGRELVRYTLANNYGNRDAQQTSWWRIVSFTEGPQRDLLLNLPKGTLLHIDADARMTQYEAEEGKTRSSLSLVQRSLEVLSRPRPKEESDGAERQAAGGAA